MHCQCKPTLRLLDSHRSQDTTDHHTACTAEPRFNQLHNARRLGTHLAHRMRSSPEARHASATHALSVLEHRRRAIMAHHLLNTVFTSALLDDAASPIQHTHPHTHSTRHYSSPTCSLLPHTPPPRHTTQALSRDQMQPSTHAFTSYPRMLHVVVSMGCHKTLWLTTPQPT